MPLSFLVILRQPFFRKGMMQPFVCFSVVFCLYTMLHNQRSMSSNTLIVYSWGCISSRPAAFLLVIFFSMVSSSFSVNYPSFLLIFSVDLSVIPGGFWSSYLKCSFHLWSYSSWLAGLNFALEVLFLPHT